MRDRLYIRSALAAAAVTARPPFPPSEPGRDVLASIAAVAWTLEPLAPHERAGLLKDEAAFLVDGLLVRVARGAGAVDVSLGEALDALSVGDRVLRLGYSGVGDYARERLGIAAGTALKLARLARALRERPLLRDAVRRGDVTSRKAETVLSVARGEDESAWVERARCSTVRALAAAVRDASGAEPQPDLGFEQVEVTLSPEQESRWDAALEVAGTVLRATTPEWQRVEALCEEYLGAHPVTPSEDERTARAAARDFERDLEAMKEALEHETQRWEVLLEPERFAAPPGPCADDGAAVDALALDVRLRELASKRAAWDPLVGHLGMLLQNTGLWRHMCFVSIGHYAAERLGVSGRALEQRAALERRLWALPALREAMRSGWVSYEKARLVAAHATGENVAALIGRAETLTCIALRRELEAGADAERRAQMCAGRERVLGLPRGVALLLAAAIRAAREAAGEWLSPGEALARIADHFVETWKDEVSVRTTPARRAIARDRGWCLVPGCSRASVHAHHVLFRSRGGSDDPGNLASLCASHHLHGVHRGWVRVHGRAPDGLHWELPAPPIVRPS